MTDQLVVDKQETAEVQEEETPPSRFQEVRNALLEDCPTVDELRAYAKEEDIGLEGATRKNDIADSITTALVIREQLAQEDEAGESEKVEPEPLDKPPAVEDTATEVSEKSGTEEPLPAPAKSKLKTRAVHWKRLIVPTNEVNQKVAESHIEIDTVLSAKAYIEEVYFANGYEMAFVSHIGVETLAEVSGHNIMLVFIQPENRESLHTEIYIVITQVGGLSGFHADSFLTSYLEQGWELAHFETLGFSEAGINCFWVMVR
ncbi:hypothetical protein LCGC14_0665660 [marine sediment metagenome]|uniref:Uncharacterized protein n=1 Tax=marine sediment metagenome TaxID=412755 RepID=A0A0F9QSA8_9ZZZZ